MIRSALSAPAGAEPLNHDEIIDWMNKYFEDFEYKVYTNRFAEIDKRITYLIIRKFKRLFEIWDENVAFNKFLGGDSFREVFALMYNEFGFNYNKVSSAKCYLECELCGEEIVLRNNDPEYSYRLHETSKYHVEFVRYLKAIRTDEEIDLIFNQTTNEKSTFFECHLCLVFIPIIGRDECDDLTTNARFISTMNSHQQDEKHRLNMEIFGSNKSCIKVYNMEEKLYICSPCEEIYHVDLLMDHLKSSTHVENSKERVPKKTNEQKDVGLNLVHKSDFEVFKTNIKLIHVIDNVIQCLLCESNLTSVNMIVEHLTGEEHTENLQNYMATPHALAIAEKVDKFEELPHFVDGRCDQANTNDVLAEEFSSEKKYQGRCSMFKSNVSSIYLMVVFSISVVFWYRSP